eukprot:TRINITY_DN12340_c0_g1_i1.p1 TRINITY_DN12340_c0_g1~~TRINITY_DN12340_c0_g1_i1.p1  ORF type:complete len:271 (-),score=48.34 TRINITY_DN12340_c0_g1_i1:330-1142(-)
MLAAHIFRQTTPYFSHLTRNFSVSALLKSTAIASEERGAADSLEYRIFFKQGDKEISPWHDIPLFAEAKETGLLNFVCEIPKESSAKMEVATDEAKTPIKQDVKKGKLRFYPYNINWNYGLLPQTWEDPGVVNEDAGKVSGDNDPVDVVEIGSSTLKMGGLYKVKPVGVYAMIDGGELDWKVIAVNSEDPKAAMINDVEDVEREFPGELQKIMEWFRDYKIPDGKPANAYGFNSKCMPREFAIKVIKEAHEQYFKLKSGLRANSEQLSLI